MGNPAKLFGSKRQLTLTEALLAVASATPGTLAVADGVDRLTYLELVARSQAVAQFLRLRGVRPGSIVAVRMQPGADLIVVLLGIMFAGAAYLPLDESGDSARDSFILADAQPFALVESGGRSDTGLRLTAKTRLSVLRKETSLSIPPGTAYVIYTSGTTGHPKGTPISHRNVLALLGATAQLFDFSPSDRWLLYHSIAFDFSVWEIWGALLNGSSLFVPDRPSVRYPDECAELIQRERITILNQTPTAFSVLYPSLAGKPDRHALRYLIFGGERLRPSMLIPWAEANGLHTPAIINMYGITETTVHATFHRVTDLDVASDTSIIGVPLPGFVSRIMDDNGRPAATGELLLAGPQVSSGYLNHPELTAARFVAQGADVFYRTGDIVRMGNDGRLSFLGRSDDQVKVRGYRIELAEVEAALMSMPEVSGVIATTFSRAGTELLGCVYVSAHRGPGSMTDIQDHLRGRLPGYMIPAKTLRLDTLPLTLNGKADRGLIRTMLER
jgi:amino acid adenylation domain-containing protein